MVNELIPAQRGR